eukprot:m.338937 g.338937  ORF g.338937 m.338937 type:complete len:884 (-) comp18606_c0_seq1:103-2754(-)
MKALAILSSVPDIVFFTADDEYLDQLEDFAEKQGMQKEEDQAVNMDALQMQLLPIFASLEMLELVESPMHSFSTDLGHSFVLRQFDDFLYLGMSDAEPQEFVAMQLIILRDFLNMLYGPVTALLRPSSAAVKLERWKATARLMSTVAEQRKKEQCYLVQAIEIIRINPFVRRICGEAMQTALGKQRGEPAFGAHAMLLVGTKLLALYSQPDAPDLQSGDLFLLGLFVQDVLGRDEAPGLEMPPPFETDVDGNPELKQYNRRDSDPYFNSREDVASPEPPGGEVWADARSNVPSPILDTSNDYTTPAPDLTEDFSLREMRREAVFLHTPSNNYAPFIMHCAEVAPSIALVVISEGKNVALSDLMHNALECLSHILDLGQQFQRRQRGREAATEVPNRIHMAVRGGTGQSCAHAQINGNFYPLPDITVDGRQVFQRTSLDMYLFYNAPMQSWCMGQDLPDTADTNHDGSGRLLDTSTLAAMVHDSAESPENIMEIWEVYDHDLREFHSDHKLQIRCVRGDGALRNRDGRWAKQSTNGLFYCEGPAQCLCGGCNGQCGPFDGCNCASCKQLDGSRGYGATELALILQREADIAKASAAESEKALRKESESLAQFIRKICQAGQNIISQGISDQLLRRVGRLLEIVASKKSEPRRWVSVSEIAEGLARSLRTNVGERIAYSNQTADESEEIRMKSIQEHVARVLKDYIDFLHVKIHRNVTMTTYLKMFPGLVHFIYVDRHQDVMIAPCLTPTNNSSFSPVAAPGREETLKQKVWAMHAQAQHRLAQGYTTLATKSGDFRYAYYLWFENAEGEKLTPPKDLGPTTEPLDASFYKTLTRRLFPDYKPNTVKCYELYLIHLSCVPFDFSSHQGQTLVRELRDSFPDVQFS